MKVFTTEHPLNYARPWSEAYPRVTFLLKAGALAMVTTPIGLYWLYCWATADIGAEPNPFPNPWLMLIVGLGISFLGSFVCACPLLAFLGWIGRSWSGERPRCGLLTSPNENLQDNVLI